MRTPDKLTTETQKRPHMQILKYLNARRKPLKPHEATSRSRQKASEDSPIAHTGPSMGAEAVKQADVVRRIINGA